jgi:hypothetical protein
LARVAAAEARASAAEAELAALSARFAALAATHSLAEARGRARTTLGLREAGAAAETRASRVALVENQPEELGDAAPRTPTPPRPVEAWAEGGSPNPTASPRSSFAFGSLVGMIRRIGARAPRQPSSPTERRPSSPSGPSLSPRSAGRRGSI